MGFSVCIFLTVFRQHLFILSNCFSFYSQECQNLLNKYRNLNLELVTRIIRDGGPWEDPVLQAILKAKPVSQELGTSFITVIFQSNEKCVQLCFCKIYRVRCYLLALHSVLTILSVVKQFPFLFERKLNFFANLSLLLQCRDHIGQTQATMEQLIKFIGWISKI